MIQWKPVPGCESLYEVSNDGQVRSLARVDAQGGMRKERVLKPTVTADGYHRVNFFREKRMWRPSVHRVVFEAFHGPIPEGHEINHKNGVRNDNRPENLESLAHADNVRYSKEVLQANYATFGNARLSIEQVREIRTLLEAGKSQRQIAAMYGLSKSSVGNIRSGHSWAHIN